MMRLMSDILPGAGRGARRRTEEISFALVPPGRRDRGHGNRGYPGAYDGGSPIQGLEALDGRDDLMVFHAGTGSAGGNLWRMAAACSTSRPWVTTSARRGTQPMPRSTKSTGPKASIAKTSPPVKSNGSNSTPRTLSPRGEGDSHIGASPLTRTSCTLFRAAADAVTACPREPSAPQPSWAAAGDSRAQQLLRLQKPGRAE